MASLVADTSNKVAAAAVGAPIVTLKTMLNAALRILALEPSQIGLWQANLAALREQLRSLEALPDLYNDPNAAVDQREPPSAEKQAELAELEAQLAERNQRISTLLSRLQQLLFSITALQHQNQTLSSGTTL